MHTKYESNNEDRKMYNNNFLHFNDHLSAIVLIDTICNLTSNQPPKQPCSKFSTNTVQMVDTFFEPPKKTTNYFEHTTTASQLTLGTFFLCVFFSHIDKLPNCYSIIVIIINNIDTNNQLIHCFDIIFCHHTI